MAGVSSHLIYLARIFRDIFSSFINYTNLDYRFLWLFKGYSSWSMWWSLKRDRNVFCGGTLRTLSPDSSCQLDVFWHDGNSPGVDSTQVGILKQTDKVRLCCLLKAQYRH